MGQKVNPHGLRVGVNKDWDSHWFVDKKEFSANIKEDNEIRNLLKKKYFHDNFHSRLQLLLGQSPNEYGQNPYPQYFLRRFR